MRPESRRGGPATHGAAPKSIATDAPILEHRCVVCGHPIFAERSVATGMGPECRRRQPQEVAA